MYATEPFTVIDNWHRINRKNDILGLYHILTTIYTLDRVKLNGFGNPFKKAHRFDRRFAILSFTKSGNGAWNTNLLFAENCYKDHCRKAIFKFHSLRKISVWIVEILHFFRSESLTGLRDWQILSARWALFLGLQKDFFFHFFFSQWKMTCVNVHFDRTTFTTRTLPVTHQSVQ